MSRLLAVGRPCARRGVRYARGVNLFSLLQVRENNVRVLTYVYASVFAPYTRWGGTKRWCLTCVFLDIIQTCAHIYIHTCVFALEEGIVLFAHPRQRIIELVLPS